MSELSPSHSDSNQENDKSERLRGIIRSARILETYKNLLGERLGRGDELILDVGSGDTTMADEINELTNNHAKVIRLDLDYSKTPPDGEALAIAASATELPFANNSFDTITSLWMMPYLGREMGTRVMEEILRVLKPGGQALLFPIMRLKNINSDIGERQKNPKLTTPDTLAVTKPEDFEGWDDVEKQRAYQELSRYLTYGDMQTKIYRKLAAQVINKIGTHRTVEKGSQRSLLGIRKKGRS